jgi:hypothetical protein
MCRAEPPVLGLNFVEVQIEEYHLLGYNAVQSVECQPTSWKNISPPASLCLPPAFTLGSCSAYFFGREDGGDMFLRIVG